ncbi:acyl-CoA carboxylase subunit epsilon (plasmid) [Streptomyces xanthophaeus]|uniref:acyl-CoA carboxylase subunit epsilon n=1 Tax=Streptomyces xanthophaeus TaxID=67385 RepID=UPI002F90E1C1|nr:acyl-CoA carboxylase subunit epsilon [Streptomyces xanthophaeus]WST65908.1 acyl-CoA carboxylase subunit epsilon [Streptomyces xanthophaeus]
MGGARAEECALRVERGRVTDEELAALTAVLCSALAVRGEEQGDEKLPDAPLWRPERAAGAYRSPYSWQ